MPQQFDTTIMLWILFHGPQSPTLEELPCSQPNKMDTLKEPSISMYYLCLKIVVLCIPHNYGHRAAVMLSPSE